MVARTKSGGEVAKIVDFGISKLLDGTVEIDENEVIIVDVPEYIKKFRYSILIMEGHSLVKSLY